VTTSYDNPLDRRRGKRPRKYGPGAVIGSADELRRLLSDRMAGIPTFIWVANHFDGGRVEDAAYTANRGYLWVCSALRGGSLLRAEVTDEYRAWLAAEMEAAK
jgi:hypothetical protein